MGRIVTAASGRVKGRMPFCRAFGRKISNPLCFSPVRAKFNLLRQIALYGECLADVRGVSKFCCLPFLKRAFRCFYVKSFKNVNYGIIALISQSAAICRSDKD